MTDPAFWITAYLLAGGAVCCLNLLAGDLDDRSWAVGRIIRAVLYWPALLLMLLGRGFCWFGIWFGRDER